MQLDPLGRADGWFGYCCPEVHVGHALVLQERQSDHSDDALYG